MRNGLRCKCPNCGKGALLHRYLKVNATCAACGEDLSHHRADDGPAYLTILLVGHIMVPLLHIAYTHFTPAPWQMAIVFPAASVLLALWLLPRMKGLIVAFQWAKRMHGFGAVPPTVG